tara:strand:+ start:33 stop:587 length:555 start_codon:yes stop_codon:yes gene_type:complete
MGKDKYKNKGVREMINKKLALPNYEIIKKKFIYNKKGFLNWNVDIINNRIKKGDKVKGKLHKSGNLYYKYIGINGKQYAEHRIIWFLINNENLGDFDIDHINKNTLDNRIHNLRRVSTKENNNNKKIYKNSKTGYPGIYKDIDGRYSAIVFVNNKSYRCGTYETIKLAIIAQKLKKNILVNKKL